MRARGGAIGNYVKPRLSHSRDTTRRSILTQKFGTRLLLQLFIRAPYSLNYVSTTLV